MKTLFLLLPVAVMACACARDSLGVDTAGTDPLSSLNHEMIELGEKLPDPYSVDNINLAVKSLYPDKSSRITIDPTDLYVRFLLSGESQYNLLQKMGVYMIDHPLDYRIVKEGDYYHDPEIPTDRMTWQYAVVPEDFVCPGNIRYEILEKCYIAEHSQTKAADVDWEEVEREAYRLTGNEEMLSPYTKSSEKQTPSGRITIVDDKHKSGEPEGVSGVMVSVNSFVKFATAYTDKDGNYEMSRSFSSDVRYRLVFKNKRGFGIGVNLLIVPASVSTLGKHSPEGLDVNVDRQSDWKLFSRCAVNNTVAHYYDKCTEDGSSILPPPSDLRIWIFQKLGSSSSPMLQHGTLVDSGALASFLGEYKEIVKMFLPDVTIGLKDCDDFASIYSVTSHEMSHASHFMRVGTSYWDKYVGYILKSFVKTFGNPYGNGLASDAGYCEVGEMWGFFYENCMFKDRYDCDASNRGLSYWFYPQILFYLEERGVNPAKIYASMSSEVIDRDSFRSSISNHCPEYRSVIDQAFERYGY